MRISLIEHRAATTGGLATKTVLDLGCLEGGFSIELGRRGAKRVLGLEYRDASVQRCNLARDLIGLDTVEFACADIMTGSLADGEQFDIVLATGILYHVDRPDELLRSMHATCTDFALIDTHIAARDRITHGCSEEAQLTTPTGETYLGRWFKEFDADASDSERDQMLWASSTNATSFWPYEDELVRMLHAAGFTDVTKIDDTGGEPWQVDRTNRVLYLCQA